MCFIINFTLINKVFPNNRTKLSKFALNRSNSFDHLSEISDLCRKSHGKEMDYDGADARSFER